MRALALAGGGVRGVVTLRVLIELEAALGARLANRCDLLAGTSTGALVACGLGIGMSPGEVLAAYRSLAASVFGGLSGPGLFAPAHPHQPLERALRYLFGARPLAELRPRVLIPVYDWRARRLRVAKSWEPSWAPVPIVDVLRGTTAAPGYLRPHHHQGAQWIDGGVAANDPTLCALAEGVALGWAAHEIRMVAVGTGAALPAAMPSAASWGIVGWAPHLVGVVLGGAADAVGYQAAALLGDRYVRLDPALSREVPLDAARSIPELEADAARWLSGGDGVGAIKAAAGVLGA